MSWLIALTPVFPPLYLAAFGALGHLQTLPLTARYLLLFFASTQLVAALFTPRPLLSLGLAAARTLLILAMIAAGVYLRESRNLRPLLWGQLVIFGTAWGYTLLTQGWAGIQERLGHPYYYVVSLGLVAVMALWITVFWRGGGWWRWPVGGRPWSLFWQRAAGGHCWRWGWAVWPHWHSRAGRGGGGCCCPPRWSWASQLNKYTRSSLQAHRTFTE